jgi:DNA-directed RNA polymerase specialized sigma subunit
MERRQIIGLSMAYDDRDFPRTVLGQLSQANVALLKLRYSRDLTFQEIALATGSTEDAVAQMHGRTLEKLRDVLAARGIRTKAHI